MIMKVKSTDCVAHSTDCVAHSTNGVATFCDDTFYYRKHANL